MSDTPRLPDTAEPDIPRAGDCDVCPPGQGHNRWPVTDTPAPAPAPASTKPSTAAYFDSDPVTSGWGFDHQRDAFEEGYDIGRAAGVAAERQRWLDGARNLADETSMHGPALRELVADLLDGGGQDGAS